MDQQQPRYKLYYWPQFPGRGELMRLLFAETSIPFDDVFRDLSFEDAKSFCYGSKKFFAVPAIEDTENENLILSQSCVIMRYLAERCDGGRLYPSGNNGYKAEVLMEDAADMLAEGCTAWHAIDYNKGYSEQAEATRPFIEYFVNSRLPKWLNRFNTVLESNNSRFPEQQQLYFVGDSLSYVDLAIFQVHN
jgi:glutathione S-transferase